MVVLFLAEENGSYLFSEAQAKTRSLPVSPGGEAFPRASQGRLFSSKRPTKRVEETLLISGRANYCLEWFGLFGMQGESLNSLAE
jgi:hypothetical protein